LVDNLAAVPPVRRQRDYTAPTPRQRFFPEEDCAAGGANADGKPQTPKASPSAKLGSPSKPLTKSHLVDTAKPGERYADMKEQLALAKEKLARLQSDRDNWAAAARHAEGKLAGLKQQLSDIDEHQADLGNADELQHHLSSREMELKNVEERVRSGLMREREADGKIAQLEAALAELEATQSRLQTHKVSLQDALGEINAKVDEVWAQNAYMQGLQQFRAEAPPLDKSHLDLRQQQAVCLVPSRRPPRPAMRAAACLLPCLLAACKAASG
jgi:predicted nuclease with TOPRIM domain